jgi:hypothetical protein
MRLKLDAIAYKRAMLRRRRIHPNGRARMNARVALFAVGLFLVVSLAACAERSRDEEIGGIRIPVPRGMSRSGEAEARISLPGLGGSQVLFRGRVDPAEVVAFYQKEMPARGWKESASIVGGGGALAFAKEKQSVLITVGKTGGETTLGILVGRAGP